MRKSALAIVLFLLLPSFVFADQIIVNSENWKDVYSSMLYGSLSGNSVNFLVSDVHSNLILNSMAKGNEITAFSSSEKPFVIGYESILDNKGYIGEEITQDDFNLYLARELEDITNFIIIDDSYGYNAISVAPYAVASNSFVLFADRTNIDDIEEFLNERGVNNLLIYGIVDRQVKSALEVYNPEIINQDGDRFANNIEIVKKYQEIKHAKQAVLTNGEFIEKEIMSGVEPVIFIGTNNVPDQVREYIQGSEIDIGILVGNELVGTATNIRREVGISVFVKFAQGARAPQGAISQVEALDMFYLPVYDIKIEIDSIRYNRATNQIEINIRNLGDQAVYFKGTYTIIGPDGTEQVVGDIDPVFLDGNELKTVVYDVEPMPDGKIVVEAYVIYGESKGSMEKALDLTLEVEIVEVFDDCEIKEIEFLEYDMKKGIFYLELENVGEVTCYTDVELLDVLIDGVKTGFGSEEVMELKKGQKNKQKIKARLTEEDIEDNEEIVVRVYYGQREISLVNVMQKSLPFTFVGMDYMFYVLLLVIIILFFLIIWKRRKKKDEDDEE